MNIGGLEINSPEYWDIRHRREPWPRTSGWARDLVANLIPDDAEVLEAGCGQGAFLAKLLEQRPDLIATGFDVSPAAIERANALKVDAMFEVADIFRLKRDWAGRGYDYIITIQNFEHWPEEQHIEALRNLWSRLRPGGKLFFTGVGVDWDLSQMNYSPMEYNGQIIETPNDYHYNVWSEQQVYDLFQRVKARSVKFWRLRGRDRVVAEAEKARD